MSELGNQAQQPIANTEVPPSLQVTFCHLTLQTPLVLLSGCVGYGKEYPRVTGFSHREAGAVCLKGTTLAPRLGNTPPRLWETPSGLLNSIGLQNPGVESVIHEILPTLPWHETRFIINISGNSIEEYAEIARQFDQTAIDAIEINISCPNVKAGGAVFGHDADLATQVVEACRRATTKPLITKLSPNHADIGQMAKRCIEAGTDALAVINTLMGMAIDIEKRTTVLGNNQGGLSGPAIKPVALLKVHQVYQVAKNYGIPIIGQGGVTSANDALEFMIAGATAVGVGTALFYDPLILPKINQGIQAYMVRHQIASLADLVGSLTLQKTESVVCQATENLQHVEKLPVKTLCQGT